MKKIIFCLLIACSYYNSYSQNITAGRIFDYLLDGNAQDSSGNNYHSTTINNITFVNDRNQKSKSAARFNGSTSRIAVPLKKGSFEPSEYDALTIAFWIYIEHVPSIDTRIVSLGGASIGAYEVLLTKTSQVQMFNWNIAEQLATATVNTPAVLNNKWHHFIIELDHIAKNIKIYMDSVIVTDVDVPNLIVPITPTILCLGTHTIYDYTLFGILDEVKIYNRKLSTEEKSLLSKKLKEEIKDERNNSSGNLPQFELYPNPNFGEFFIKNIDSSKKVEIYDNIGRSVGFIINGENVNITAASGIYTLMATDNYNKTKFTKFVIAN